MTNLTIQFPQAVPLRNPERVERMLDRGRVMAEGERFINDPEQWCNWPVHHRIHHNAWLEFERLANEATAEL